MDQGQLDALYQQYLGRGVDPSGAASWGGADYNTVVQGILGSQEYQNRQQQSQPQQQANGVSPTAPAQMTNDPKNLNGAVTRAYEQILGRAPSSQELSANVAGLQRDINSYTWLTETLANSPEAAKFHANDNTPSLDIYGNPIVDTNGNQVYAYDPTAVANQVKATYGNYVQPDNMSGLGKLGVTLGNALPYAVAAAMTYGAGSALGGGAAATEGLAGGTTTGTGITGGMGGSTGLLSAAGAPSGLAATQSSLGLGALQGLIPTSIGMEGVAGAGSLAGILGSQTAAGLGGALAGIGLSLTPEQLAAYEAGALPAAELVASGLSASQLANLAKSGLSAASLATKLFGSSGTKTGAANTAYTGINPNALANALKGITAPATQTGSGFGLARGNVNPFAYTKDVPTQTLAASKADPFAALNVAQTPITPYNPLAHLVG